jgi:C4-dicarboxylate transporter, DctQ subunit
MEPNNKTAGDHEFSGNNRFRVFLYVDQVSAHIETVLNFIGVAFIFILMVLTASEIIARYAFNHPIPGYVENVELMMAAIVFLGIAYTQRVEAHIRMDLVISKIRGRFYHIAEVISLLLGLIGFSIIFVSSLQFTLDAYQMGDVTEYLYTPTWPSKLCVPIGSLFLCIRFAIQIIRNLAQAIGGDRIEELE